MRTFVGNDQAYLIVDTTKRADSVQIVLKAISATPLFWSQERSDLESNIDSAGNPQAGMPIVNTDPPLVLNGARMIVWARASAPTKIEVQVLSQQIGVSLVKPEGINVPGASNARLGTNAGDTSKLPCFENSFFRKAGI